MKGRRGSFETF